MKLPSSLNNKIVDFLISLPNIDDPENQRAFVYHIGLDPELQSQIIFGKAPNQFIRLLVSTLFSYGKLHSGQNALEVLLETAKNYIGEDRQIYCNVLIKQLQQYIRNAGSTQYTRENILTHQFSKIIIILIIVLSVIGVIPFVFKPNIAPFKPGVFGIIVAAFGGEINNQHKRNEYQDTIRNTLAARFQELHLVDAKVESLPIRRIRNIKDHQEARKIGQMYGAEIVIWGNATLSGIIPNITIVSPYSNLTKLIPSETSILKDSLVYIALDNMTDIRFPSLTEEPTSLVSFITGLKYYKEQKYKEAIKYFENSLPSTSTKYINRTPILFYLGNCYYLTKEFDKALEIYDKVLEIDSENFALYNNIGSANRIQGNYSTAIDNYDQAIVKKPEQALVYYNRGNAFYYQKKCGQAILDYTKAISLNPNYAKAYHNRAICYALEGNYKQAMEDYEKGKTLGIEGWTMSCGNDLLYDGY